MQNPTVETYVKEEIQAPRPETPSPSQPPSEQAESTVPTTPSSIQASSATIAGEITPTATKTTRTAVPLVPIVPKKLPKDVQEPVPEKSTKESQIPALVVETTPAAIEVTAPASISNDIEGQSDAKTTTNPAPKAWSTPKSWTGLFNAGAASSPANAQGQVATAPGIVKPNAESFAEALRSFSAVSTDTKVAFLEPRGLVNTGNMCYMNSVSIIPCYKD